MASSSNFITLGQAIQYCNEHDNIYQYILAYMYNYIRIYNIYIQYLPRRPDQET